MISILSIGSFANYGISNTCLHRTWALDKYADKVVKVNTTIRHRYLYRIINRLFQFGLPLSYVDFKANINIKKHIKDNFFDIVWIDKGVFITRKTLKFIKKNSPHTKLIGYSPDNMAERHNQSQNFIDCMPYYDYYITTKSYTVEKLKRMGCNEVIFVNNAYEEKFHHPYDLSVSEKNRLGGDVGFIGAWEKDRCESIKYLAKNGIKVKVWGAGKWLKYKDYHPNLTIENKGLYNEEYSKALSSFKISLCFLRKLNFDLQTTRTMEIPACGSLLMAERTIEHEALFKEGEEAEFFSNNEELLQKCRFLLDHPEQLNRIKLKGRQRCLSSGYSNTKIIAGILNGILLSNS